MSKKAKPGIYKYHDVVEFLNDVMNFFKQKEGKSLREFAGEMNIATGMLPMVLNRKRIPTVEFIGKVMAHFGYNTSDIEFAVQLRTIGFSENNKERTLAINKINKVKKYRETNRNEHEIYKYLTKWYYVAIKEMTELSDFEADPYWIQNRLAYSVPLKDIEEALEFLTLTGILVKNNKKLTASNKNMNCEEGIFKITLGAFHNQVLELTSQAIDNVSREQRKILGHTFKVDEANYHQLNKILDETFEKIKKLEASSNVSEEVYHVELISIPMTKSSESK